MVSSAYKIKYSSDKSQVLKNDFEWISIPLQEIFDNDLRLEAGVYATDAEKAKLSVINNQYGAIYLSEFIDTHHCPRFKRIFVDKSNLPIYQPSQIRELNPSPSSYISARTNTKIDALRVKKGQLLMTCSGTVGKVTLVSNTLNGHIFSHDLLRINVINEVDTGYLYTYFVSETGRLIVQANNYGAVIKHIEPEHLLKAPIPNAPLQLKKKINKLIMESFALRDKSNELVSDAQALLKKALKLPSFDSFLTRETRKPYIFTINVANLNERLEANYHHPVSEAIREHLSNNAKKVTYLSDKNIVSTISLPGRYKRHYVKPEYGVPFIGGKELLELDPRSEKYLSLKLHNERISNELSLAENMILITRSGTIGKVNIVPEHWNGWTASEHLLRVVPISSHWAGYLFTWLSSEWALPLIRRHTYGAVVFEIDQQQLSQVEVPLVDEDIMMEINELALSANKLRTKAFNAEQAALDILNKDILGV
ncbi:restriction endonuclease subunit S [Providencia rettgeri]|uniref:restriction endonuclease subunit S n=1 Tax=Providencia rettgeri TaxID=587 RepID=UPI001BA6DB1C|nr:restriction endonuclease subunit S [Providencia rettgeri]MBS0859504.1 restriction endonuclease subunit S [Providencia rettgeri]MBS0873153.1 restriction endonuclease subunit S [Providencia rettgeri]MBS0920553.1 restriction endonuclease subunit S [Providencia rettgeri]